MARSGRRGEPDRNPERRRLLVDAAISSLREVGYAGTSARSVAARAGCNQGLVFYYFGSVEGLLLAALDEVSARRRERHAEALGAASTPGELATRAAAVVREDLEAGHLAVLAELIAASSSSPSLREEIARRLVPWTTLAADAIERLGTGPLLGGALPTSTAARGVVALVLGLELLDSLDGDHDESARLLDLLALAAGLLGGGVMS